MTAEKKEEEKIKDTGDGGEESADSQADKTSNNTKDPKGIKAEK